MRCWRNTLERRGVSFALAGVASAGGVRLWYFGSERGLDSGKDTGQGCISFEALKAYTTTTSGSIVCASSVLHLSGMTGFFRSMAHVGDISLCRAFHERTNERQRAILIVGGFLRRLPGSFFVVCREVYSSVAGGFLPSFCGEFKENFFVLCRGVSSSFAAPS